MTGPGRPGTLFPALLPPLGTAAGRTWLLTFSDLMCLLLTFFVMLYAMGTPPGPLGRDLLGEVPGGGPLIDATGPHEPGHRRTATPVGETGLSLGYLRHVLTAALDDGGALGREVRLTQRDEDLVLSLPSDLLFAADGAVLSTAGASALAALAGLLDAIGNAVEVVGHADPSPPSAAWPSNWELSLARAQGAAKALMAAGYSRPLTVRGQGDAAFAQLARPDLPVAEQRRLARRVDLVVREHRGLPQ